MSGSPFSASSPPSSTTVNVPAGAPTPAPAASPVLTSVLVGSAAEESVLLPASTVRYMLRIRSDTSLAAVPGDLRIALVAGQTFLDDYLTLRRGLTYTEVDLKLSSSLELRLRTTGDDSIVELFYWTV